MPEPTKPGRITPELAASLAEIKCVSPSDQALVDWLVDPKNRGAVTKGQVDWLQSVVNRGGAKYKNE